MSHDRTRTYSWDDPLIGFEQSKTMSGLDYMRAMLEGRIPPPPIAKTLDFLPTLVEEGRVIFSVVPSEFHYNPIGVVHGGLAATLLDSALGCAVQTVVPMGMAYTTIELHVNYVRAITKDSGQIDCEATILHLGRQLATAQAKITDAQGKLYAHGTTTCLIFPMPSGA